MLTLVVGLALVAGVTSANGQIRSQSVTATIPFDFVVGDKTLPAGRYIVSAATNDGTGLRIENRDGKYLAFRLSNPVAQKSQKHQVKMVFNRYGQQYFLTQIWSGDGSGRELRPSKMERNLQQELAANAAMKKEVISLVR